MAEEEADCAGCARRSNGTPEDPWAIEETVGGCTFSYREIYSSYSQKCTLTSSKVYCTSRTCTFTWRFEAKHDGAGACASAKVQVIESSPPGSPVSIPIGTSYQSLIDSVSQTDAMCGYSTSREGSFAANTSPGYTYDFTIGCHECDPDD